MTVSSPPDEDDVTSVAAPIAIPTYDFDEAFQQKIAAMVLRDTTFALRTDGLIEPQYFENASDGHVVAIALDYVRKFKKAPDKGILGTLLKEWVSSKKIRLDEGPDLLIRLKECVKADISDIVYVSGVVAEFAKKRAMEEAIVASAHDMARGDTSKIEARIARAQAVGVNEDLGEYDYFAEIGNRTDERIALASGLLKPDGITTGYAELDNCLGEHRGWGRKELSLMMGAPKAGKSMSLADFAKCASLAGYQVLFATCEVSAKITSNRLDANISATAIKVLKDTPFKVKEAVELAEKRGGKFKIHEFASGTLKPSMLRRLIAQHRAKGLKFDLIVVDYADIMAPETKSDREIDNMRGIYLDLRAIAFEENAAVLTATQTNREGAKAAVAKMTDVAEDINKVRTADVVISINATDQERDDGEARLFFAAMRNDESGFTLKIKQNRAQMKFITAILGRV